MRLFITGGGGFAGRNISEYFIQSGNKVVATYRTGHPQRIPGVQYVRQELSEEIKIEGHFDAIIHTAVSKSGKELPVTDYVRDNVESAKNIVCFARKNGIRTVIYFSTRTVYGEIRKKEIFEENDIINPNKYGATKRIAEQIFQEAKDLNTIGLRIPNIIGPGAHDIWLTDITSKIQKNESVEISDYNTKNLVAIGDVSKFIDKLVKQSLNGTYFKYNIINLSCAETVNNLEIAEHIRQKLGSSSNIIKTRPSSGLFWLNSEKAVEMGFRSSSPIEIIDSYIDSLM